MAIDRSKFKKTSASQLTQSDKDLNKTLGKKEKLGNGHEIEDGLNLFRAYPVHPDTPSENDLFVQPFVQTFLPAMVQEKDDKGNLKTEGGKPKMKLSVRPVWNTKVHGNKQKDLVEEYITLARKNAKDMGLSDEDSKEYLKPIYGFFSKDPNKNVQGINYPLAWVMYADKYPNANSSATPVFDELRIKKAIKERLNKIAAVESANDPMGTDPFTDVEEGKAFKVIKDSEATNPQNFYTTELDNSSVKEVIGGRTVSIQKTYPLTDTQLEHFMKQEPLAVKYGVKLCTRKNFEAQLTGLELLDNKWQMGIFSLPEWSEIVAEIDSYYPEVDEPSNESTGEDVDQDIDSAAEDNDQDEFDLMDRKELQQFARDYKTGILVKPSLTDDDVREKLRTWKSTSSIEHVPLPGEEGYEGEASSNEPETKDNFVEEMRDAGKSDKKEPVQMSAKEKLMALRAKAAAKTA